MTGRAAPAGQPGPAERIAGRRMEYAARETAVALLGAHTVTGDPYSVMGECGHPMTGQEWIDGWRVCKTCPQEPLFDLPLPVATPPGAQP